jgi:hypothetical protein
MDSNGNAIAVWHQNDGTRNNICLNQYSAVSTSWGTAQQLGTATGIFPRISMNSTGTAMVVWLQGYNGNDRIFASRYVPGTGWSTPQMIEPEYTENSTWYDVAINANGNAVAVWERCLDGGQNTWNMWANIFKP